MSLEQDKEQPVVEPSPVLNIRIPSHWQVEDDKTSSAHDSSYNGIPESVLQYERQLRKVQAANKASAPLTDQDLDVIYVDESMVVVNKPSGVLCAPGIHNHECISKLVYEKYAIGSPKSILVHRLDMDTSGLVVFARTTEALTELHKAFRDRHVEKEYHALVCGHLPFDAAEIDLPLQRDHRHPPFMRIATPVSEHDAAQAVEDLQRHGWKKLIRKRPKPSQTGVSVLSREYYPGSTTKVTRLSLKPHTGRTHQLRVHCAALAHPIVGDPAYGIYGEASMHGGLAYGEIVDLLDGSNDTNNQDLEAILSLQKEMNELHKPNEKIMCLHAKLLRLRHPVTGEEMTFEAPTPF